MESNTGAQQTGKKEEKSAGAGAGNKDQELPTETSPYVTYTDVEDYKRKGYGTEGHQQPVERNAAGSTDAPTLSGADVPLSKTAPNFANLQP